MSNTHIPNTNASTHTYQQQQQLSLTQSNQSCVHVLLTYMLCTCVCVVCIVYLYLISSPRLNSARDNVKRAARYGFSVCNIINITINIVTLSSRVGALRLCANNRHVRVRVVSAFPHLEVRADISAYHITQKLSVVVTFLRPNQSPHRASCVCVSLVSLDVL